MKVRIINISHLSQALHLQFVSEIKSLGEKFYHLVSRFAPVFAVFCASVEKEDLCYKIIRKSDLSEAKENADQSRDAVILGINEAVRTALRHFEPAVNEAAKRLKIVLDAYNTPKPLTDLPYDAETIAIVNLLQEFDGKYAADVQVTGLSNWVEELRARNNAFDRLAKAYNEQQSAKPPFKIKDVRGETDEAYKNIVTAINGLIVLEGESAYAPFVTELNELIKHYSDLLAQHEGRRRERAKTRKDETRKDESEEQD
jgi:hypothetical protein